MYGGDEYKDPTACFGEPCGLCEPWVAKEEVGYGDVWTWCEKRLQETGLGCSLYQPFFVLQKQPENKGGDVAWPEPQLNPEPVLPPANPTHLPEKAMEHFKIGMDHWQSGCEMLILCIAAGYEKSLSGENEEVVLDPFTVEQTLILWLIEGVSTLRFNGGISTVVC